MTNVPVAVVVTAIVIVVVLIIFLVCWLFASSPAVGNTRVIPSNIIAVTVQPKTVAHPFFGSGSMLGFVVNGVEGGKLDLKRNVVYTFDYNDPTQAHPLYFTSSDTGGGPGQFPGTPVITTKTNVCFDDSFPSSFFYQCTKHERMGGIINLV